MAGVSTKEIKNRIRSMQSTRQITKAMEMVASSKLRRTQQKAQASRPYFEILSRTIENIVAANREFSSPYLQEKPVKKTAFVVFAGDRGLAGGYNSNVLKLAMTNMEAGEAVVIPVGKKSQEFFKSRGVTPLTETYAEAEDMKVGDCFTIAKLLCKGFLAGEYQRVCVVYTEFVSVLQQTPKIQQLLPLQKGETEVAGSDILYEPDSTEVFRAIVPEYVGGMLYGALCESRAAEQAARRTAMDAATQNADEMIGDLSLQYNRARQAAITQEITEIVAGS